jgi:glycosyltransferase involved in cell wall biosynthesis
MPIYNAGRYLRPAVESVLAQTFRDFELVAVDDGSKDESLSLLQEYAAKDSRVKIVSRPNTGIVGALNDGLAVARGEFVARMDADDICTPDRFEKQVAYLREHTECVLVGSQVLLIDPDGAALCPKRDTEYTHERIDAAHLEGRWPLVHPTVMIRRSALTATGGYRGKYQFLEDLDLFLRLAEVGRLASLRDVLLHYRLHPGSICHTRDKDQDTIRPELEAEVYTRRGMARPHGGANIGAQRSLDVPGERFKLWGWWALVGGNISTARKYAVRALRVAPLQPDAWKLMFCAIRGH